MPTKRYLLSDGKVWTAQELVVKTGLSISTIRCRLKRTDNIDEILGPRQDSTTYKGKHKVYNLDDGTQWTTPEVAKAINASLATAAARLYRSTDPEVIFSPVKTSKSRDNLKLSTIIKDRMCYGDRNHWLLLAKHS